MPEHPREKEEPVVRETSEAADGHLGDMLQQLHSVNASKPSERGLVRQGGHCGPGHLEQAEESQPWSAGAWPRPHLHHTFTSPVFPTLQPRQGGLLAQALHGRAPSFFFFFLF